MLFEQKTLLIAPSVDLLIPIAFALHSLIYPFKMCLFVPCLLNDGEQTQHNTLNLVSSPLNYFIGVSEHEKAQVLEVFRDDEFEPPLVIDLTDAATQTRATTNKPKK
jgi:hypothetical protein